MVIVTTLLGPWLLLITSRQTALFNGAGGGPPGNELLPVPVTVGAMVLAIGLRVTRPSIVTQFIALAAVVGGLALLAASLGAPFANATATYCGDFCRSAIMARMGAFLGWPLIAAAGLTIVARIERAKGNAASGERAEWARAWVFPTLILGFVTAVAWLKIVLP